MTLEEEVVQLRNKLKTTLEECEQLRQDVKNLKSKMAKHLDVVSEDEWARDFAARLAES